MKKFEKPELEVITFDGSDIITASTGGGGGCDDGLVTDPSIPDGQGYVQATKICACDLQNVG